MIEATAASSADAVRWWRRPDGSGSCGSRWRPRSNRSARVLVTHAQRAAWHFHARAGLAVDAVVAFFGQLVSVHLGWRSQPQTGRDTALDLVQQLAGSTEVADVGHARTDEHFVDLLALYRGQQAGIVRVVRRAEHRLFHVGQVDFDDFGVFGIGVGRQQLRLGQPGFHGTGTALGVQASP